MPTWLDPELTGLPGATGGCVSHLPEGGRCCNLLGAWTPKGLQDRGTKSPKCWVVLACGTALERPSKGLLERVLLNEHAGTKVSFTGAGGHEGEVTGGLVPGVAPWGPLAVVDARG